MEGTHTTGQSFCWKKEYPENIRKLISIFKVEKHEDEKSDQLDFLPTYQEVNFRDRKIEESKVPNWMDVEIKIK